MLPRAFGNSDMASGNCCCPAICPARTQQPFQNWPGVAAPNALRLAKIFLQAGPLHRMRGEHVTETNPISFAVLARTAASRRSSSKQFPCYRRKQLSHPPFPTTQLCLPNDLDQDGNLFRLWVSLPQLPIGARRRGLPRLPLGLSLLEFWKKIQKRSGKGQRSTPKAQLAQGARQQNPLQLA